MRLKYPMKITKAGIKYGYQSGLEEKIHNQIQEVTGVSGGFHPFTLKYKKGEGKYTPDFILPNEIIIETKGRFISADRTKHILIKEQYPELDIRFVFTNPNAKINETSTTTYANWCDKYGFKYAKKEIPLSWFKEKRDCKGTTYGKE